MHKAVADRGLIESATVRARVSWLVAGRLIISTALLGSATLLQFTVPGTFPVNPFFLLIGADLRVERRVPGDAQAPRAPSAG